MKNLIKIISAALLGLAIFGCTVSKNTKTVTTTSTYKIINGIPVTADQILSKSVVGLMKNFEYGADNKFWLQSCTASVLNQKFILTAAHCVNNAVASDLAINFSLNTVLLAKQFDPKTRITDIENTFVIRKVKSYIQHPLYDGSGNHDLALILLETEVPSDAIPVQILPDQFVDLAANKTTFDQKNIDVLLMGFGLINEYSRKETDILRSTTVPAIFDQQFIVTDQTKGSGGCNGDSGGPAFYTFENITYQVGVTHGPHANSQSCHEQGEWVNPALNKDFLVEGQKKLLAQP
jgi:secreted trypsin-like serine protease